MGANSSTEANNCFAQYHLGSGLAAKTFLAPNLVAIMKDDLEQFMTNATASLLDAGVSGGASDSTQGGHVLGGKDVLQNYGDSVFSKAKEALIRNIAEDVFAALKYQGSRYARTASIGDVVAKLAKVVPNPSKGGKFNASFNSSKSSQSGVINAIATAINKHYGSNLIDDDASPSARVQAVGEVMHSLLQGLHTEFMSVAGDVLRVLRNMQALGKYIDASYKKQKELVDASGDSGLKQQSASVEEFYNRLNGELKRQMAMVSNMLNVAVGPTGKELIGLLESNNDFQGLVKDLKGDLGTDQFGTKIAYMLTGVSSVAHSAALIEKALKVLGMKASEFRNSKSKTDLRLRIFDNIQKKKPSSRELEKLMAAAEIIYKHDYDHTAIARKIKGGLEMFGGCGCGCPDDVSGGNSSDAAVESSGELTGAYGSVEGSADSVDSTADPVLDEPVIPGEGAEVDGVEGGADSDDDLPAYWSKKSLSKKIKKKEKYRGMLLKDFKKLLLAHYRTIVVSSDQVAKAIGKSIPVNDDLDRFIQVFGSLPSMNQHNLHVALSGYAKDATSKNNREVFMNKYRLVNLAIEPLAKGPGGNEFRRMQSAIKETIKAIDNFSDNIVEGLTEIHIDRPEETSEHVRRQTRDFFGSAEMDGELGSNSFVEFDRVKMEMSYRFSIAHIKTNLSRVADEMTHFGKGYEAVLGEEAGWLINSIKSEYNALIDGTDPAVAQAAGVAAAAAAAPAADKAWNDHITDTRTAFLTADQNNAADKPGTRAYKAASKLWRKQRDAKVKMVEVAQAVDLYLRSFADGMARHPDSVGSVVKMLDQVELVAKWFNERSGDNLAGLFEVFPNGMNGDAPTYSGGADGILDAKGLLKHLPNDDAVAGAAGAPSQKHYYAWLESKISKAPGNPTLGRPLSVEDSDKLVDGIFKLGEKTVKSMRALENILSAFATVGSKFGNLDPQSKTFMNPGQIFNALCEYITASAFTTGFAPGRATAAAGAAAAANPETAAVHTGVMRNGASAQPSNDPANKRVEVGAGLKSTRLLSETATAQVLNGAAPAETMAGYGVLSGVANVANAAAAGADAALNKVSAIAMASLPDTSNQTNEWGYHDTMKRGIHVDSAGWHDRMFDTDKLFIMTVKSIVCKVFTVVDAYRLFNRPSTNTSEKNSLNPLRTILGGGRQSVKIIPDAIELYMRLPLLAEWYRDMFGFKHNRTEGANGPVVDGNSWVLSIVPAVDGTWSEFIKLIFDSASYINNGNYTETHVQRMVLAINKIYKSYKAKYSKATCRAIMNSFAMEMNRIFGFIKQKEIDSYFDNRRSYLDPSKNGSRGNGGLFNDKELNYDILNADDQFGRSVAPSDKFVTISEKTKRRTARNAVKLQEEIEKLRFKIDVDFKNFTSNNANVSFNDTLLSYRQDVTNARGDTAQYKVVLNMIQGSGRLVNASADKLVMLHESVAAPLMALHNLYQVVDRFNCLIHGTSAANIMKWNKLRVDAAAGDAQGVELATAENAAANYALALGVVYPNASPGDKEKLVAVLLGEQADRVGAFNVYMGNFAGAVGSARAAADAGLSLAAVNWSNILRDQLSAILDLSANSHGLVTVSIGTTGAVNVDFSRLEDMAMELLASVKNNINKMRFDFAKSPETLAKYEDISSEGSVAWLSEYFVEKLFKNRDGMGLDVGLANHLQETFKRVSSTETFANGGVGNVSMAPAINALVYWASGNEGAMNSYAINDATTFPFNVVGLKEKPSNNVEKEALTAMTGHADFRNNFARDAANSLVDMPVMMFAGTSVGDSLDADRNSWKLSNTSNNSLLLRFNHLVYRYLHDNMDDGTKKFYMPLIETFMNGPASLEVIQNKAIANVFKLRNTGRGNNTGYTHAVTGTPPGAAVLFQSSVDVMKAFASVIDPMLKKKRHTYDSMAEIPEYMKERMRGNLPYYSKLFAQVYYRSDLLRRILSSTDLKNNMSQGGGGAGGFPGHAPLRGTVLQDQLQDSSAHTEYLLAQLNRLTQLSHGIKQCNDLVYKELQDVNPYFMDVRKNFSKDYKQQHGVTPLMPASNMLLPQNSMNGPLVDWNTYNTLLLPTSANGSDVYKFNYASRLLLARNDTKPLMIHMPGAVEVYANYARSASRTQSLSSSDYQRTILQMVDVARFLNDGASHGRLYAKNRHRETNARGPVSYSTSSVYRGTESTVDIAVAVPPAAGAAALTRDDAGATRPYLFQQRGDPKTRLTAVLNLAENPNHEKNKEDLAKALNVAIRGDRQGTRKDMRTANILDMNIVPVNVHAFMREVPFVNILNYSYTFDRMIHDFVLPSYVKDLGPGGVTVANLTLKPSSQVNSTREIMVKLLTHPYANLERGNAQGKEYFALMGSLFNGNDNLKLGRPRYLSDQLWHKALLSSSVQLATHANNSTALEAGPQAYEAQRAVVHHGYPLGVHAVTTDRANKNVPNNDERAELILAVRYDGLAAAIAAAAAAGAAAIAADANALAHAVGAAVRAAGAPMPAARPALGVFAAALNNATAEQNAAIDAAVTAALANGLIAAVPEVVNARAALILVQQAVRDVNAYNATSVHQRLPSAPVATPGLKYFDGKTWRVRNNVVMDSANVLYCAELGLVRYNTKLVRNLSWIVQLQRVMRVVMIDHLDWISSPVVKGLKIINPVLTEYESNDQFNEDDFNGVKYSAF